MTKWITIVETKSYLERAQKLLNEEERERAAIMIAKNPYCGDRMEGTNGIRKVRLAVGGRGKSAGVRIVYYYYADSFPVFLLTLFAKNEKANLTKAERNQLASLVKKLIASYE